MKLLEFDPGLIFWTFITFGFLLIVLKMVAWKPILTMLEEREKSVREALEGAEKARQEVADLSRKNQEMLDGVRRQADEILGRGRIEVDRVRTGRRYGHRPSGGVQNLFCPARHFRRPDRHQVRLFTR